MTDIQRIIPQDEYVAMINADAPDAANPFATMNDLASLTVYIFSSGLTNTLGTITNNLVTGLAGGQTIIGGTAASEGITISSTSDATKGVIKLGTANDEVVNIGDASTAGQKLLRVGTGTNLVDIGQVANGPNAGAAIWFNQITPSTTNYTLFTGGASKSTSWNINSPTSVGNMAMSVDGVAHFTYNPANARWIWQPAAVAGGGSTTYRFITPANTNQVAGGETIGFLVDMTATIEHAAGNISVQRDAIINARTHSFVGASIIAEAATLTITGAPIAGALATITRPSAIWVQAGETRLSSISTAYAIKSIAYGLTGDDRTIEVDTTGATQTLPTAANCAGREYRIINASLGVVRVDTTSSQTIGNKNSGNPIFVDLNPEEWLDVVSNGTNWRIV